MNIYQVGGSVRDELLGISVQDRDYVVIGASEQEFLDMFPRAKKVGRDKPVYIHKGCEYTLSDKEDIYRDLWSRDLTVNSMAKSEQGELITIPGAVQDLENKILCPVREENFFQDGLRVYRVCRMAACFPGFEVHESLWEIMRKVGESDILRHISAERVGQEVRKACACPLPGRFLRLLGEANIFSPWFEELRGLNSLERAACMMDKLAGDPLLVWMGLCRELVNACPEGEAASSAGHAGEGKEILARNLGVRLRLPKRFIQGGAVVLCYVNRAERYPDLPAEEKVDFLLQLHKKGFLQQILELLRIGRGKDLKRRVHKDLQSILQVRLPEDCRNQGKQSGEILKRMRSERLQKD